MWSGHDAANHHFRRYTRATLEAVIAQSGLKTELLQSFNSLLFPLAVADRLRARVTGREGDGDAELAPPVYALFKWIFGLERHLIGRVPMPPGVSMVALLTAP
jgi:hypothetical protein